MGHTYAEGKVDASVFQSNEAHTPLEPTPAGLKSET
jgi:hypothetical protein